MPRPTYTFDNDGHTVVAGDSAKKKEPEYQPFTIVHVIGAVLYYLPYAMIGAILVLWIGLLICSVLQ